MGLTKLRALLSPIDRRNADSFFDAASVVGLSTKKEIIRTKADLDGVSLTSYKLFPPNSFAYVPDTSRRGDMVSLAFNDTEETYLVSAISVVFEVCDKTELLPEYLFMYFNRPEFDRYARFNSWGSAREPFTWEDMCDIEIDLPSLPVQQKYVDIYTALLKNQRSYERGLDDLKLTCDAYIEALRRKMPAEEIGTQIHRLNQRNKTGLIRKVMGLSTAKQYREPSAKVNKNEISNYKIVPPKGFSFVPTTDTWKVLAFGLNQFGEDIVVSPIYEVFECKEDGRLLPEYLAMWLSRKEFDRYARYNSWGSARENFVWEEMCNVKIPIPCKELQQSIVDVYNAHTCRKSINERLKAQLRAICPILIKGSLEEATA